MNENFLLSNPFSRKLYAAAGSLPVVDFHNHLSAADIDEDKQFSDLAELWLLSDPYKHRAMRICGVPERLITGDASAYEKFEAWSAVVPQLYGNPLYHWGMLELKRIFGIDSELNPQTCRTIWDRTGAMLRQEDFSARSLLKKFRVEYAAPCTALTGDLTQFGSVNGIVPSLRGDGIVPPDSEFLKTLERETNCEIRSFATFVEAVSRRIDAFHKAGCRFADHALDNSFRYTPSSGNEEALFHACLNGAEVNAMELESAVLRLLAGEYAKRSWTMQLHIGAERRTSSRLRRIAGAAGGYAGIGHTCDIKSLTRMLDDFESAPEGLPRVILYTLNPADSAALAVLSGSYTQDGVAGKVQLGPAWWFCDHLSGMRECFENIAAYGVLSTFVGMTTDSRSLLSFVRHEYFRRCFCGWIGEMVERGEMPDDFEALKQLVGNVFYYNSEKLIGKD